MHDSGLSKLVHWGNPEGLDAEGGWRVVQDGGTHVQQWLSCVNVWQKMTPIL